MNEKDPNIEEVERILRDAINKYGVRSQMSIAIEEMAELTVELLHYLRCRGAVGNITEEMADVKICLLQLGMILDNDDAVNEVMASKLIRLRERVEMGGLL